MIPSMNWSRKLRNCQSFSLENQKYISCWELELERIPTLTEWLWWLLLLPLGILMMVPRSADARQFWKVFEMKARQVEARLDWRDYLSLFLKVEPLDLQKVEEAVRLEADGLTRHVAPDPGRLEDNQWVSWEQFPGLAGLVWPQSTYFSSLRR